MQRAASDWSELLTQAQRDRWNQAAQVQRSEGESLKSDSASGHTLWMAHRMFQLRAGPDNITPNAQRMTPTLVTDINWFFTFGPPWQFVTVELDHPDMVMGAVYASIMTGSERRPGYSRNADRWTQANFQVISQTSPPTGEGAAMLTPFASPREIVHVRLRVLNFRNLLGPPLEYTLVAP